MAAVMSASDLQSSGAHHPPLTEEEKRRQQIYDNRSLHDREVLARAQQELAARKAQAEASAPRAAPRFNNYSRDPRDNRYGRLSSPPPDMFKSPRERGVISDTADKGPTRAPPAPIHDRHRSSLAARDSSRDARDSSRSDRGDDYRDRAPWPRDSDREQRRDRERSPVHEHRGGRLTPPSPRARDVNRRVSASSASTNTRTSTYAPVAPTGRADAPAAIRNTDETGMKGMSGTRPGEVDAALAKLDFGAKFSKILRRNTTTNKRKRAIDSNLQEAICEIVEKQLPHQRISDIVDSAESANNSLKEIRNIVETERLPAQLQKTLENVARQESRQATEARFATMENTVTACNQFKGSFGAHIEEHKEMQRQLATLENKTAGVAGVNLRIADVESRLSENEQLAKKNEKAIQDTDETQGELVEWQDETKEKLTRLDQGIKELNQKVGAGTSDVKEGLRTMIKNDLVTLRNKDQEYVRSLVGQLRNEMNEMRKAQEKEIGQLRQENEKLKKNVEKSNTDKRMTLLRNNSTTDVKVVSDLQSTVRDFSLKLDDVRDRQLHLERQMAGNVPPDASIAAASAALAPEIQKVIKEQIVNCRQALEGFLKDAVELSEKTAEESVKVLGDRIAQLEKNGLSLARTGPVAILPSNAVASASTPRAASFGPAASTHSPLPLGQISNEQLNRPQQEEVLKWQKANISQALKESNEVKALFFAISEMENKCNLLTSRAFTENVINSLRVVCPELFRTNVHLATLTQQAAMLSAQLQSLKTQVTVLEGAVERVNGAGANNEQVEAIAKRLEVLQTSFTAIAGDMARKVSAGDVDLKISTAREVWSDHIAAKLAEKLGPIETTATEAHGLATSNREYLRQFENTMDVIIEHLGLRAEEQVEDQEYDEASQQLIEQSQPEPGQKSESVEPQAVSPVVATPAETPARTPSRTPARTSKEPERSSSNAPLTNTDANAPRVSVNTGGRWMAVVDPHPPSKRRRTDNE